VRVCLSGPVVKAGNLKTTSGDFLKQSYSGLSLCRTVYAVATTFVVIFQLLRLSCCRCSYLCWGLCFSGILAFAPIVFAVATIYAVVLSVATSFAVAEEPAVTKFVCTAVAAVPAVIGHSDIAGKEIVGCPALGSKSSLNCFDHKVHIFKEYHSVCPLIGIGTLPPPLSPSSVPLPA
jgi:hypothetical protein